MDGERSCEGLRNGPTYGFGGSGRAEVAKFCGPGSDGGGSRERAVLSAQRARCRWCWAAAGALQLRWGLNADSARQWIIDAVRCSSTVPQVMFSALYSHQVFAGSLLSRLSCAGIPDKRRPSSSAMTPWRHQPNSKSLISFQSPPIAPFMLSVARSRLAAIRGACSKF